MVVFFIKKRPLCPNQSGLFFICGKERKLYFDTDGFMNLSQQKKPAK